MEGARQERQETRQSDSGPSVSQVVSRDSHGLHSSQQPPVPGPSTSINIVNFLEPSASYDFDTSFEPTWIESLAPHPDVTLLAGDQEKQTFSTVQSQMPDLRLLNALGSQRAYINGDPSDGQDLELFYYRFVSCSTKGYTDGQSGTTAIR
jgi:hypothetical protein